MTNEHTPEHYLLVESMPDSLGRIKATLVWWCHAWHRVRAQCFFANGEELAWRMSRHGTRPIGIVDGSIGDDTYNAIKQRLIDNHPTQETDE